MTSEIRFPTPIIGLMSGTSADGVDAAILTTDGRDLAQAGASLFVPYEEPLRAAILALMHGEGDEQSVAQALTDVHIRAVRQLMEQANGSHETVGLIGFHGQTIRHAPHEGITQQIGDAARMARELGIPVVADFRSADVRAGGQGAPLVPLYHAALAHNLEKPLMVVNIGGVSNVTWIGEASTVDGLALRSASEPLAAGASEAWGGSPPSINNLLAFDCGTGNALLDDWVHRHTGARYDKNGEMAARGQLDAALLAAFLHDPFFAAPAPKSLDRNHFNPFMAAQAAAFEQLSPEDGAATLTAMTAHAITAAVQVVPQPPKRLLICGGGRHNPTLMGMLQAAVGLPVEPVEAVGWDGDMLEAQAFAYLAARSVQGLPLSLPTTTGVKEAVTGGVVFLV